MTDEQYMAEPSNQVATSEQSLRLAIEQLQKFCARDEYRKYIDTETIAGAQLALALVAICLSKREAA